MKEHRVYAYEPGGKKVPSAVTGEIGDGRLGKGATTACWKLAKVYKDAHYGGDSMWFSQETEGPGYFHKIIYNLGVSYYDLCFEDYYGGFNDCISSHEWGEDYWWPYKTVPDKLKVWKHANRQGPSHTFENGHQRFDDDWQGEIWWNNGVPETINDKVSSLDMMYWVSAP